MNRKVADHSFLVASSAHRSLRRGNCRGVPAREESHTPNPSKKKGDGGGDIRTFFKRLERNGHPWNEMHGDG